MFEHQLHKNLNLLDLEPHNLMDFAMMFPILDKTKFIRRTTEYKDYTETIYQSHKNQEQGDYKR